MNLKNLITIQVILFILGGLGSLLAPQAFLSPFGVTLDESGVGLARLYGVTVLMAAVICWLARDAAPSEARRAIVIGLIVGNGLAFIAMIVNILSGAYTSLAWVNAVFFLLLAIGFGYFQFRQPDAVLNPSR
jgi:hypothetical protein